MCNFIIFTCIAVFGKGKISRHSDSRSSLFYAPNRLVDKTVERLAIRMVFNPIIFNDFNGLNDIPLSI